MAGGLGLAGAPGARAACALAGCKTHARLRALADTSDPVLARIFAGLSIAALVAAGVLHVIDLILHKVNFVNKEAA